MKCCLILHKCLLLVLILFQHVNYQEHGVLEIIFIFDIFVMIELSNRINNNIDKIYLILKGLGCFVWEQKNTRILE